MNYDQHQTGSVPGPIAAQDWFLDNLKGVLKTVPKNKIICSLGNYGYDWTTTMPPAAKPRGGKQPAPKVLAAQEMSTQDAWQAADDAEAQVELDSDSLNVHFAYDDDDAHVRHQVWFLDAVTIPQPDARGASSGHRDLPRCGDWLRGQLAVEDMGPTDPCQSSDRPGAGAARL